MWLEASRHFARKSGLLAVLAQMIACGVLISLAHSQTNSSHETRVRRPSRLPLSKFYDAPSPTSSATPGALIRSERTYDYSLSADVSATRILYYSRRADGQAVPVSGVVLVPERPAPTGGWPVIAWAHRFEGVARQCAPSLQENLDEGSFLSMYLNLGYAVVATDYAGLGSIGRNAYVDLQSNAADVSYSISAARAAVPDLGPHWVAMGIAEGGLAAAGVAELEHNPNFLGSVALSGIVDGNNLLARHSSKEATLHPVFLAYGIKSVFPEFEVKDILNNGGLMLYKEVENSCTINPGTPQSSVHQPLKPNWQENTFVQDFLQRNTLGKKAASAPLLVLASATDPETPITFTTEAVARLCKQGDRVQFYEYQNPDARAAIGDSVRDQIGWIQARFAHRAAPSHCR